MQSKSRIDLPPSVGRLSGPANRAGVFACAGVLAALNAQAGGIIQSLQNGGLVAALFELGGISVVIWFAMYAALQIGVEDGGDSLAPWDVPVLTAIALLTFAPASIIAAGALLFTAIYLLITSSVGQPERRVALVLMALTGPLIWGPAVIAAVPQPLLDLDAHIVAFAIQTPVYGNVVRFASGSDQLVVAGRCSSVHNMSLAVLLWTTAAMLFNVRINVRYIAVGLAMVALMFVLNITRIAAIGLFPQYYQSLHVGVGGALFAWAGLLGSGLLAALGTLHATANAK